MAIHHLIVGGQRSGKSRHAEALARRWLAGEGGRAVTVIATALAGDEEMSARIARHRADRPPAFETAEVPLHLGLALSTHSAPHRLLVVDCLTLWVTNWLMPIAQPSKPSQPEAWQRAVDDLLVTLPQLPGPVVLVSNEVGWGVSPMGREVRHFVDELGRLNQAAADRCGQLTLMVAGQPWTREVAPW